MNCGDTTWGQVIKYVWDQLQCNEFNLHLGVATIWQAGTVTREFAQEFEWRARDAGMAKEDAKVHLVSAIIQDTLTCLATSITMHGGDKMAHLETVQDWLVCIPYIQMLAYLK